MFIYEDYTVKNFRTIKEKCGDKISNDEFRGASEVFTALYKRIGSRQNFKLVSTEISNVMKRFQDDMQAYQKDEIKDPPSFTMDEVIYILYSYIKKCKQSNIDHSIGITKEMISIEVTSKAGVFYPEMRKAKLSKGSLLLSGEVLATVIMKIFDPRFKTSGDFRDIILAESRFGVNYFEVLKIMHSSTFKNDQARKLENIIEIDIVNDMKGMNFSFELKDGSLNFVSCINDFLPVLMKYISRGPDLSLVLVSTAKKQLNESLEKNLRLFTDEIHKAKLLQKRKAIDENLEELPSGDD